MSHRPCGAEKDSFSAAIGQAMSGDEFLKNTFANNAFEKFEIAAYTSLLSLCRAASVEEARAPLEQSLQEEERRAEWVDSDVEKVTLEFVRHEERQTA
ncbi:DUF892 family protein [Bradyrhizobium sp. SZCCHNR1093]|uniref:DUF892 family protein n=1 Tax=Bradyrhizobium sp. SZCCHNR1093 TaxID=3057368 RepID=UPI0028E54C75|nr:DUF892 family protein [Bradyrhizobium sp. SZCCHNR1093]